jgi:hypothetical protein
VDCLAVLPLARSEHPNRGLQPRTCGSDGSVTVRAAEHSRPAKRNPASEIRPSDILKTTRKVNYARIDAKELPTLLRQIEVYPGTHVTRLAIKLMALTAEAPPTTMPCT